MKTQDFFYDLPKSSIAQSALEPRESCKLAVLKRSTGSIEHAAFSRLGKYLQKGDCLVINDSKVLPLRIPCRKIPTGAAVEILLLNSTADAAGLWEALIKPGRRAKTGTRLAPVRGGEGSSDFLVEGKSEDGIYRLRWNGLRPLDIRGLEEIGLPPLPPYIEREYFSNVSEDEVARDRQSYQTVFASHPGSAAAPTAGLHFSAAMLDQMQNEGIIVARVTLHVGMGTFLPVKEDEPEKHKMHEETYEITAAAAAAINQARADKGRVIAVGTTSLRVLESVSDENGVVIPRIGKTNLFILPGYKFKAVDGLLTNFHVPCSTLLMLVSALDATSRILALYKECLGRQYRFLSYGDAMLIL